MKIVLQNKKTRCYSTSDGHWTSEMDRAMAFANTVEAEKFCKRLQIKDAWILLKSDGGTDVTLPCGS